MKDSNDSGGTDERTRSRENQERFLGCERKWSTKVFWHLVEMKLPSTDR